VPGGAPQPQALERQLRRLTQAASGGADVPWLHTEVARRLADKLEAIRMSPAHWLEWGGRLGGGAELVAQRYPQAQHWVCEPTPELADLSRKAWQVQHERPWWAAWRKTQAPVIQAGQAWPEGGPHEGAGLLWANMALHTSADLDAMLRSWHQALCTDGFLMCSGLGPDTARELRAMYQQQGWSWPTVQFIDMHDLGDALVRAGFAEPVMDMERLTLTWADAPAMLAELRTWGGNVAWGRFAGLRTPRWQTQWLALADQHLRRPDGRLGLTIEIIYGHAIKPALRAPVSGETRVSLGDMRRMIRGGTRSE
jgi:malonyl-CoA O-methyltransferase